MAKEYKIILGQVIAGNFAPITSGSYSLYNGTNTYTATCGSDGSIDFGTVENGFYKLKVTGGSDVPKYGERYICDDTPNFTSVVILAGGSLSTDTISETTSGAGVTIDGVKLKDSEVYSDVIKEKTTGNGVSVDSVVCKDGKVTCIGLDTTINTSGSGDTNRPKAVYSDGYSAPINDSEYTEKKYVDDKVATITATPFQESPQKVRVIVNGTSIANKIYLTIATAINSFGSPAITKQCIVEIQDTGNASQYISLAHSSLVNYVHLKGIAKHINLILGIASASVTANVNFNDLIIFMGANDITTDRTYNSVNFENCDIYAYKSLTFTNCKLTNCRIFQPNGEDVTVTGTTQLTNCILTNALTASGLTGVGYVTNTTSEVNTSYTMPTDPSSGGS